MSVIRPLDDRNLVTDKIINRAHSTCECAKKAERLVNDVRANEKLLDDYLVTRVDDHIHWLLESDSDIDEESIQAIRDCLYKFALIGFLIGKDTYSTKLPVEDNT